MSEMQGFARIKIHDGKLAEFERLAAKCMEIVRTKDTGTLQYEMYMSADRAECLVFERYRDSEAGLQHSANVEDLLHALLQVFAISGEVCGVPSPELRKALESQGVRIYAPFEPRSAPG